MEQENRRTQVTDRLIGVILIGLIAVCGVVFFSLKEKEKSLAYMLENTQQSNAEITSIRMEKEEEKQKLLAEIDTYKHLEERTKEKRKEFFSLASLLEQKIQNKESDLKIAYLTFDDGPYLITTKFLDVLEEYDIQATFFERARDWGKYEETYNRVAANGHTIGNHTYSHTLKGNAIYASVSAFEKEVVSNREYIQEKLDGYTTEVFRFPGGSSQPHGLKNACIEKLRELNYAYVDWNAETGDGKGVLPVDQFRDNVLNNTNDRKFLVVLMHDYSENTLIALPEIIEGLRDQGYVFLPLFYESVAVNR